MKKKKSTHLRYTDLWKGHKCVQKQTMCTLYIAFCEKKMDILKFHF